MPETLTPDSRGETHQLVPLPTPARPHLVLLGPPGAGKSTVSELIVQELPVTVIATGKRLRQEIAAGTAIGREIGGLLEQGHFAPDVLMDRLLREWLAAVPQDQGFMLDGYPRNLSQAQALEGMLADLGRPLDAVIALQIDDAEAIRRLSGRRVCRGGGESFTLHLDDYASVKRCLHRGGTLEQRDDDKPEVIAERLRVYARETAPLIEYYTAAGLLHDIDADGSPAMVIRRVREVLKI